MNKLNWCLEGGFWILIFEELSKAQRELVYKELTQCPHICQCLTGAWEQYVRGNWKGYGNSCMFCAYAKGVGPVLKGIFSPFTSHCMVLFRSSPEFIEQKGWCRSCHFHLKSKPNEIHLTPSVTSAKKADGPFLSSSRLGCVCGGSKKHRS